MRGCLKMLSRYFIKFLTLPHPWIKQFELNMYMTKNLLQLSHLSVQHVYQFHVKFSSSRHTNVDFQHVHKCQ